MKILNLCLTLIILQFSNIVYADYGISFVRPLCIPEMQYFRIDYESFHGDFVTTSEPDGEVKARTLLKNQSFYDPRKFEYLCKIKDVTYRVVTTQSEPHQHHCGVQPDVSLSLYENDTQILKNIDFGSSCYGDSAINKIEIRNPIKGGGYRTMYLWIRIFENNQTDWKLFSDAFGSINKEIPIDQKKVSIYAKEIRETHR